MIDNKDAEMNKTSFCSKKTHKGVKETRVNKSVYIEVVREGSKFFIEEVQSELYFCGLRVLGK